MTRKESVYAEDQWYRFLVDWVVIAPLIITASWAVGRYLNVDMVGDQLAQGALVCYGLSCFVAHYDDLDLDSWSRTTLVQALRLGVRLLWWIVILLGVSLIVTMIAAAVVRKSGTSDNVILTYVAESDHAITEFGYVLAAIALIVATAAVLLRIKRNRAQETI